MKQRVCRSVSCRRLGTETPLPPHVRSAWLPALDQLASHQSEATEQAWPPKSSAVTPAE